MTFSFNHFHVISYISYISDVLIEFDALKDHGSLPHHIARILPLVDFFLDHSSFLI